MKKKKVLNKKKLLLLILTVCFLVMFLLSCFKILNYLKDNKVNRQIQRATSKAITVIPADNLAERYKVDFETLRKQNSDTVAYLKVNNTKIDYVVVQGNDNKYYLDHNFNKSNNVSGWIFADYRNRFDGTDRNIIIYGHNTRDGAMFGTLRYVLDSSWYQNEENNKVMLITTSGVHYYQVFSTYMIDVEDYYINTEFNDDEEFETFIKRLKFRSNYAYKVNVYKNDKILTLSTCSGDGKKRIVLHARLLSD